MLKQFEDQFHKLGFDGPTQIQAAIYDPMVKGEDLLGLAPTGSGKTLAFVLPTLAEVMPGEGTQVLILAPSQELAMQTTNVVRDWARLVNAQVLALTGGANLKRQMERLKKHPEVVVGTPGRVASLIDDRRLKLHQLETLVIDEADDLLTGETLETVRRIAQAAPADCQLGFFSATDTDILHELPKWFGKDVRRIDVRESDQTQGEVKHELLQVNETKRDQMLKRLLAIPGFRALVFFDSTSRLAKTAAHFKHDHISAVPLTSGLRQTQRQKALTDFRLGHVKLLLTTDVAARGLDIPKLPAVVNYDRPTTATTYVHRAGRTGRMGEPGEVITFGDDHDLRDVRRMLSELDYSLTTVYYTPKGLTTTRPIKQERVKIKPARQQEDSGRQPAARQSTGQHQKRASQPSAKVSESFSKKHRKNKHNSRKGMRKKRRDGQN
ncbi:DEAD/DEAH box helicase [Levilactobacillus bambusae]|uniref:Helicase n=1 Tax=Levilactobacillus bambusae TaxID=2024736 RepID=A0A2V1N0Q5_9LACO|nr:DEAD/DEAH box helicase [Levilactobacillus bambusae]PWF99929.1 helicase [Levilactobacillus bambusae]